MADVAGGVTGLDRRNTADERLVRDLDQPFGPRLDRTDCVHAAGITVPAIDDQRDVDVDDVAIAQRLRPGNAMANDVIDRRADRLGVAAIIERRRKCVVGDGELEDQIVETLRGHTGLDVRGQHIECGRRELPCLAHGGKRFRPMQLYRTEVPGFDLVRPGIEIVHACFVPKLFGHPRPHSQCSEFALLNESRLLWMPNGRRIASLLVQPGLRRNGLDEGL